MSIMHPDQWDLGQLIDALEQREKSDSVRYDFEYFAPTTLESYRGFYDHLALGYAHIEDIPDWPRAGELVARFKDAIGTEVSAWKGGEYTVHRERPLWVANLGSSGQTAIVGLAECDYQVVIRTEWIDV